MSRDDALHQGDEDPDEETPDEAGSPPPKPDRTDTSEDDDGRELDARITQYLRFGLPAGTAICAFVGGMLQGAPAVVLVLAAGALVAVIAIFWASIRTLVGETPLSGADAYALGAPRAEEEKKRAVLRALKDLEFERSVGKISEEDYQALVAKYRAEGKRLIRLLDEDAEPRRHKAEALVAERLFQEGLAEPAPEPYRGADAKAKPVKKKKGKPAKIEQAKQAEVEEAKPACASCGVRNDPDAVFCKKCGARQGEAESEPQEESAEVKADLEKTS